MLEQVQRLEELAQDKVSRETKRQNKSKGKFTAYARKPLADNPDAKAERERRARQAAQSVQEFPAQAQAELVRQALERALMRMEDSQPAVGFQRAQSRQVLERALAQETQMPPPTLAQLMRAQQVILQVARIPTEASARAEQPRASGHDGVGASRQPRLLGQGTDVGSPAGVGGSGRWWWCRGDASVVDDAYRWSVCGCGRPEFTGCRGGTRWCAGAR